MKDEQTTEGKEGEGEGGEEEKEEEQLTLDEYKALQEKVSTTHVYQHSLRVHVDYQTTQCTFNFCFGFMIIL